MTTLAEITLQVAKQIMDVMTGTATAGAATSLTDTAGLTQSNQWWDKGTLWILSGTHAGKVVPVTGFSTNKLTFATLTTTIGTPRYAVARSIIPLGELVKAVNQALEDVRVTGSNETLTGDGVSLEFTLPAGVSDVYAVEFKDARNDVTPSAHWKERNGKLIFDTNYAPWNGDTIRILYKAAHAELVIYSDVIDDEINITWLKWQTAANALRWGLRTYGNDPVHKFDEFLNEALKRVETMRPLRTPRLVIHTAG